MGYYINPLHESKEKFAGRQKEITREQFLAFDHNDKSPCLVDNGIFTALPITNERQRTGRLRDHRPKRFFLAQTADLLKPETGADAGFERR